MCVCVCVGMYVDIEICVLCMQAYMWCVCVWGGEVGVMRHTATAAGMHSLQHTGVSTLL